MTTPRTGQSTPRCGPRYKLTYFDGRGRGEPIRLIFKAAGVPFIDNRISFEEWGVMKQSNTTPFGSVPVLETDGKVFGEALAIMNWMGGKFGMSGKTDEELLTVQAACLQIFDVWNSVLPWAYLTSDPEDKKQKIPELKEKLDKVLKVWEEKSVESQGKGKTYTHIAGTSLTVADILIFNLLDELLSSDFSQEFDLDRFRKLLNIRSTVASLPRIKEYLESRS